MKHQTRCGSVAIFLALATGETPTAFAQGSLTPPGPPAATMKSLAQIEPREPISSVPYTIGTPGSYYLTTNLSTAGSNGITIASSDVTLDLNGFTISSTASSAANGGSAILLGDGISDITIEHGHIQSGVTTNSSGVFSGPGFTDGINFAGNGPMNVRVADVSVTGCLNDGIYVIAYPDNSSLVESCTVQLAGGIGIAAVNVRNCVALACYSHAIFCSTVADSEGQSIGSGAGIYAQSTAQNCYGYSNSALAPPLINPAPGLEVGGVAQNCYGYGNAGGNGLSAGTALNCYGISSGDGDGLSASSLASNCSGTSSTGTGLYVEGGNAQNSQGFSYEGDGLVAYASAENCLGQSNGNQTGLSARIASFCEAISYPNGTAIQATVATGCYALIGTNAIVNQYNMP